MQTYIVFRKRNLYIIYKLGHTICLCVNHPTSSSTYVYHKNYHQFHLSQRQPSSWLCHDQWPMPRNYPHPYIQLNKLMSHIDSTVPKSYPRIESIAGDPQCALGYIIHHFNIEKVSKSLCTFPNYAFDQVYYSTYIDTSCFNTLLRYYKATHKQLDKALKYQQKQIENALAKEQLEIQKTYG